MNTSGGDLNLSHIYKTYYGGGGNQVPVLADVSLKLAAGENMAITGPSGSGKSTLLQIIGTLDHPDRGEVVIGDTRPFELDEAGLARFRNREIGFIFQEHHLLPQYSVLENVLVPTLAFPPAKHAKEEVGGRDRALELLDKVGLAHRLGHRPGELSGGERQRVAVARALTNRPRLLLCDEPTGSLDSATAGTVSDLLLDLHAAEKTILIVVTHSLTLAQRFARRIELQEGLCVEI